MGRYRSKPNPLIQTPLEWHGVHRWGRDAGGAAAARLTTPIGCGKMVLTSCAAGLLGSDVLGRVRGQVFAPPGAGGVLSSPSSGTARAFIRPLHIR
jgi:hypothetical protein